MEITTTTGAVPSSVTQFASTFKSKSTTTIRLITSDEEDFHVQQDMLEMASPFFKTYWRQVVPIKDRWNKIIRLDASSETVEYFLYWLFHDEVPFAELDPDHVGMDSDPYYPACRLWIFGERYKIPKLQNIAMNRLYVCKAYSPFAPILIDDIFDESTKGSLLQRWLAREATLTWRACDLGSCNYEDMYWLVEQDMRLESAMQELRSRFGEPTKSSAFMLKEEE